MPLVAYDSSSSEEEPRTSRERVRTQEASLPSLPPAFRDLYTTAGRVSTQDDPALHGGRTRQVPHVEGNWPSHVFIEWHPTNEHASALSSLVASVASITQTKIHSALISDLGVPLPLHISLSAPLILQTEQRTAFLSSISRSVRQACRQGAFEVCLGCLQWASNDDGSRWFLVVGAHDRERNGNNPLVQLLDSCNEVAAAFGQPKLYKQDNRPEGTPDIGASDKFHFSIGWTLTSPLPSGRHVGAVTGLADNDSNARAIEGMRVRVDTVKIKIGNAVNSVALERALS